MIKNSVKYTDSINPVPLDEIDSLGKGLHVLITSDYKFQCNWMAFASWYSVAKNLPHATVGLTVARPELLDRYLFNWVYKLDIKYFMHKNVNLFYKTPYLNKLYGVYVALKEGILKQPLLVIDSNTMAVNVLSSSVVDAFRNCDFASSKCFYDGFSVGPVWYFNNQPLDKFEEALHSFNSFINKEHLDLQALSRVFKQSVILNDLCCDSQELDFTTFVNYPDRVGSFDKREWEKGKTLPPFRVCRSLHSLDMTGAEKKILALWEKMANLYDSVNQVKA